MDSSLFVDNSAFGELSRKFTENNRVNPAAFDKYSVKKGLRNPDGTGVMVGLTKICNVEGYYIDDGEKIPKEGRLNYRGIDLYDFVGGCTADDRFGYEELVYLLLFGVLPTQKELDNFCALLALNRELPFDFVEDVIMRAPSPNIMNKMGSSVTALYAYDPNPDDISVENVLRQSIQLIAQLPAIMSYAYQVKRRYFYRKSMYIHPVKPTQRTAEVVLNSIRSNRQFSDSEAKLLDLCLIIHADHGGGNNSTFTTHVVTSSGTDTYSAMAAALGSLKGPRHGGANIKVVKMFEDIKAHVSDWDDEEALGAYLQKILQKEAFDRSGLIYGIGHAVYSVSDPRARIMSRFVEGLSREKGRTDEYRLYTAVERLAVELITSQRKMYKGVSANVDFYSGFIYSMLDLPMELYTPIFAISRIAGWSAHRIEELVGAGKIIRPAYKAVQEHRLLSGRRDAAPTSRDGA